MTRAMISVCSVPEEGSSMTPLKRKTVFLPVVLWDLLNEEAKVYNLTVSHLMEKVVNDYFRLPNNDQQS